MVGDSYSNSKSNREIDQAVEGVPFVEVLDVYERVAVCWTGPTTPPTWTLLLTAQSSSFFSVVSYLAYPPPYIPIGTYVFTMHQNNSSRGPLVAHICL